MPLSHVNCIYCGQYKNGSREHVLQDALGGVDVLSCVCQDCNDRLSVNDRVLSDNSPLSLLARRELGGAGPTSSWDVDAARNNLLLEARPTLGRDSMTLIPQIIFDGEEVLMYYDGEDLKLIGSLEAQDRFYTRLRRAYGHFRINGPKARKRDNKGHDMLKLHHMDRIRTLYRYPPRICCNERITDFGSKPIMFDLRFHELSDRDRVLDVLANFDWEGRSKRAKKQLGSEMPEIRMRFCLTHAIQALAKVGYNLLANFCRLTPVNRTTFRRAVDWILHGRNNRDFGDETRFGFVIPSCVTELKCPAKSHKFRLAHDKSTDTWKLYASFFESKAAAYVAFSGPNQESWGTMDVVAPYNKPFLTPSFDAWYRPLDVRVALDPTEMLPSISWQSGEVHTSRVPVPS